MEGFRNKTRVAFSAHLVFTSAHMQTRRAEFPGLRRNIFAMVPPSLPAPCLHLIHPVFNTVSPTTNSLDASAARGDANRRGGFDDTSPVLREGALALVIAWVYRWDIAGGCAVEGAKKHAGWLNRASWV